MRELSVAFVRALAAAHVATCYGLSTTTTATNSAADPATAPASPGAGPATENSHQPSLPQPPSPGRTAASPADYPQLDAPAIECHNSNRRHSRYASAPDCQIEVYACLFILHFLPSWMHLTSACTISILGSNATLHVDWAHCGVSRLVLAVNML